MGEDQHYAVSHEIPAQDGDHIRVLAAVITRGDRYLVCLRPADKRHGGHWEFPGGKVEPGETMLEAARRELREELDVDVLSAGETVFSCTDPGSNFLIEFVEVQFTGIPRPLEHDEICWVTTQEMRSLKLAASDRAFSLMIA